MKSRGLIIGISLLAIIAIVFALLAFVVPSSSAPNENLIRTGFTAWGIDSNPKVHGETVWSRFADYPADEEISNYQTVEVGYTVYWGQFHSTRST